MVRDPDGDAVLTQRHGSVRGTGQQGPAGLSAPLQLELGAAAARLQCPVDRLTPEATRGHVGQAAYSPQKLSRRLRASHLP